MKPNQLKYLISAICVLLNFALFGQNNRLYLVNGFKINSDESSRVMDDRDDFEYGTVHYQFDETTCPNNNYNNFDNFPEDVKTWAPNDLDPSRHEALYYDERFDGSEFLCFGISNYKDIGLKYAFVNNHYGDPNMTIAIIDSGLRPEVGVEESIFINTDEIPNNGVDDDGNGYVDDYKGYDFFYGTGSEARLISDQNSGHGSNMARIIVGEINNDDKDELGVCPNCQIMNLKVFGSGDESQVGVGIEEKGAASIRYAVDNGAKIIMLALGYGDVVLPEAISPNGYIEDFISDYLRLSYSVEWYEALEYAWDNGVLVVGSAGNMSLSDPAIIEKAHYNVATNHHSVIQVGGVYPGIMAHHTRVARPGRSVDLVVPDRLFVGGSWTAGTSEATALVAGMIGNFWSEFPSKSHYEVKKRVLETATDDLWSLGSNQGHYYLPDAQIVDVWNPSDEEGILPRSRWATNAPLTDDVHGWDEYFGFGLIEFENLFTGNISRSVNIDEKTGSVEGYNYPTTPYLEDYSQAFQDWIDIVLNVDQEYHSNWVVYPNPAIDFIEISGFTSKINYTIYDLSGVLQLTGDASNNKINVSSLEKGTYLLSIRTYHNLKSWNGKIIIK